MIRLFSKYVHKSIAFNPRVQLLSLRRNLSSPLAQTATKEDGRLMIGFTCNVCSTRSHKFMSKKAYNHGVVIVKCDGCSNLHLIADHLQWFDTTKNATGTIEDIMKKKGETVTKLKFNPKDIESNSIESQKQMNQLFASSTPADLEEIDQGLLEWLPKK